MRLRKLILSTGLAVAMVATSIPAIAGTTPPSTTQLSGWAYNGVHFEFNDGKAALAKAYNADYEAKDEATTVNGFAKITSTVNVQESVATAKAMGATLTDKIEAANQKSENNSFLKGALTITYTADYTSKVIPATDVTGLGVVGTEATAEEAKKINDAVAAKKAAIKELENSVTAFESTKAGVNPSVIAAPIEAVNGSVNVDGLTEVTIATTQAAAGDVIAELAKPYSVKQHVETTEIVTDLPDGYTFDFVLEKDANDKDNYEYHIWSQDSSVSTSYKDQADAAEIQDLGKNLMVSLKTLDDNVTYFLTAKVVSTTKNLICEEPTVDGLNIAVTPDAEENVDKTAKEFIDKYVIKNDLKHIAYLDIAVTKKADGSDVTETETALTFKIAVPTDLPALEDGKTRVFKVIRLHDGEVVELPTEVVDGYIVFSSNLFSDYALVYSDVAAETTEEETKNETESATEAGTETTTAGGTSTTSKTSSSGTADNSMMPIVVVSLLLALCAGSVAVYKEKKTL